MGETTPPRDGEQWIFPGMPVLSLLKARPAALVRFEAWGLDPWLDPRAPLETLASARRLPWDEFEAALAALPGMEGERDWSQAGIPELLDHLVIDHRDILEGLVPRIGKALLRSRALLPALAEAWPAFSAELAVHMREEETFLFPRILHYDHSLRHLGWHPDFGGGSVNVYIAIRLLGNEQRQMHALRRLLPDRQTPIPSPAGGEADAERLRGLLAEFQDRIERHNHLEEVILYPKARDLEKALYDAAIAGTAAP